MSYLIHYASKYYDPQKAHEYYEEHKQLKGRSSTAGLNEEGRKVAKYVKNQINEEKKSNLEKEKTNKETSMETYKAEMKSKISKIQAQIKQLSKNNTYMKTHLQAQINGLRKDNQKKERNCKLRIKQILT